MSSDYLGTLPDNPYVIALDRMYVIWCETNKFDMFSRRGSNLVPKMIKEINKIISVKVKIGWLSTAADDDDWNDEYIVFDSIDDYNLIRLMYNI